MSNCETAPNFIFFTMHRDPEDAKVEANCSQGYTANTNAQGMSLRTGGLTPYSPPSTGPTRLVIDFSVPNPHLYDGPSDRLPPNWSNVWEDFPFRRRLFPLVNGRIFASLDIELHNHISGEIYFIMYNESSEEAVIRIGTRYFVYHFETDMLLEFLHTYLTLDAFLDLARQWEGPLSQAYTLTPFVGRETDVTPDNYYEEVEKWEEEKEKAKAAHALMNSRQLCYL
ncbi:hypothetical protein EDD85DRAFT_362082 [Armillaria nabsnona]|nr:hypothetical protein EDD85DRAFT_362082 [Armillaria nabsnona]